MNVSGEMGKVASASASYDVKIRLYDQIFTPLLVPLLLAWVFAYAEVFNPLLVSPL